ncbi:ferritin-like fold-containing protein [Leifsonia sp. YIM 134122]|uniref:Ferritin-like fold-containing protein n=1 Tax=Leifsonia stereocauli TaxID=3134136 RepID=A0ABU9W3B5_9MICO
MKWFPQGRRRTEAPRRQPRVAAVVSTKVEFGELTPETLPFLGQAAYIQLELFENLARAMATAPTLADKASLSTAARFTLRKHHRLAEEIRALDEEPAVVMAPFAPAIDAFRAATTGATWHELMITNLITAGMLDDFFISLSGSLPDGVGSRVAAILSRRPRTDVVADALAVAIVADPQLASPLAMWGRRLVGDTLLVARSALRDANARGPVDESIEPAFTDLIAAHTRRMDSLGLTA